MLDAIIRRAKNFSELEGCVATAQICDLAVTTPKIADDAVTTPKILDDNVTAPKIGPDSINDMDHDHIDPDWSQWGGLSAIAVDAKGWFQREVTFPAAFPSIPNWLLASVKRADTPGPSYLCQPSGLKVFLVPCNITAAGFRLNIDVNASCNIVDSTIDVSWIARRMPAAWVS